MRGKLLGRLSRVATGQIVGTLREEGGPSGYTAPPIDGDVGVLLPGPPTGHSVEAIATPVVDGRFTISDVPVGRFVVEATSPKYNDGRTPCRADHEVTVTAGQTTTVAITCQLR